MKQKRLALEALPRFAGSLASGFLLFLVYVVLGWQSLAFVIPPNNSAVFWLPSGVSVALFIRARNAREVWIPWLIAAFLSQFVVVSIQGGIPIVTNLAWSTANFVLCSITVLLARRFASTPFDFRGLSDVMRFVTLTVIAVVPSGLIAGIGHSVGLNAPSYLSAASTWALSDALGIILVSPVILTWSASASKHVGKWPEALLLFLSLIAASIAILFLTPRTSFDQSILAVLLFFVAWAAIRFGPNGSSVALLLIDGMTVIAARHGLGPPNLSSLPPTAQLLNLQILLSSIGVLMLLLAAALEEQRAARQTTEEALRLRDEFLLIASHELKTPITSLTLQIQMWSRMLKEGTIGTVSREKQRKMTDVLLAQVQRLTGLIADLLDASRIAAGRFSLDAKELDLSRLIGEIIERYSAELSKARCAIEVHAAGPILGHWDPQRIEQVLANLLTNAMRYGAGKPIEVTAHSTEGGAEITVRDHGAGIAPKDQKRIFERFERASSSRSYGGLGLGLYISRQIVEAHGGSIRVESILGQGATFFVELPSLSISARPLEEG